MQKKTHEANFGNPGNEGPEHDHAHHPQRPPYWKRAHRDWWFWVGLVLMLAAISIYVLSDDLMFLPRF